VPYLTPDELPEDTTCRVLFIPANSDWLAIVSGALTELVKVWNWEQFGAVAIEDAVAAMQTMIDGYYDGCDPCETPGGYKVIRINTTTGRVEQLDGNGDWVEPTGDYVIPAPGAREDGTPDDQICLAAKNAVNVLHTLYESLADSWNGDLDDAEAMLAIITVFTGVVGFAVAPIAWGIYAFFAPIFAVLFAGLEYLIADLWDEAFSDQLTCFLVECAVNDGGVVTFDYDCLEGKLNSLTNTFSLTEEQLRLYLQVMYLLWCVGGIDAVNLAGRTTEITNDDCSNCDDTWCYTFDFTEDNGGWVQDIRDGGWGATYSSGVGWQGSAFAFARAFPASAVVGQCIVYCGEGDGHSVRWQTGVPGNPGNEEAAVDNIACDAGLPGGTEWEIGAGEYIEVQVNNYGISHTITRVTLGGTGENPFGDDNCE